MQRKSIPVPDVIEHYGNPPALDLDALSKQAMRRLRASIARSANKQLAQMGLRPGQQRPLPL